MKRNALVIGAGIGGLAAALGLRRAGWSVSVFERAPEIAEVGAGIAIWANGLRTLDALGVGAAVRALGLPDGEGWLRDWRGAPLLPLATAEARARYPELGLMLHRADLHALLLEALGRDAVRLDARLVDLADDGEGVEAVFADGTRARGDLLVGADGLHSVVRARLHGEAPPRYAGYTAWRAVVPFDAARLRPGESWGRGARFGHAPLPDGRVYMFATRNAPAGERGRGGERAELLRTFGDWHDPIPALLDAVREEDVLRNDVYDRPVLRRWGRGRITLLGDAAHPMTPNLGQGACQALEDAVVLARHLAGGADAEPALRAYEAERAPRANAFVTRSRQAGAVGQWTHPLAVRLRTGLVRHVIGRLQPRQLAEMAAFQG
jgi:2-polyprenyl-6-methoxyphenol hydroxylase-like FAD-dependent oxidoreductase